MRTIAVVNQKGGCGKTITSINLSAFLACARRRVLVVDMDPQSHATLGLLASAAPPAKTMYEVFLRRGDRLPVDLHEVILPVRENLDVAPADILLSAIPEILAGRHRREDILSDVLAGVGDEYDYVVIDCPPNVGLLTFNALKACTDAGAVVVERVNKFPLVLTFLGTYFGLWTAVALVSPAAAVEMFREPFLQAALFLAFFMLTDPPTAPGRYGEQVWVAILVAAASVAGQLMGVVQAYLQVGLLAGNAGMFVRDAIADRHPHRAQGAPRPAARMLPQR